MEKTRAKFKCNSVTKQLGWGGIEFVYNANFSAVMANSEENKLFFASTPGGNISLSTVREDHFQVGKEYYVDFTEVTELVN